MMNNARLVGLVGGLFALAVGLSGQQPQPPRFQSSVEVTSIDATVLDNGGRPVLNLQPTDFTVKVDGAPRRVVSAEWVPLTSPAAPERRIENPAPEGYSTNENATGGRLIVIAVDQPNIGLGAGLALSKAVGTFLDGLEPSDRVAAVAFGQGGIATPFTADRQRVKQAVARMSGRGQRLNQLTRHNIGLSEAMSMVRGDPLVSAQVMTRECEGLSGIDLEECQSEVGAEALMIGQEAEEDGQETVTALRVLLEGLKTIDAPKTLVLISQGFLLRDTTAGLEIGSLAAAARTSVYVVKLDTPDSDITDSRPSMSPFADRRMRSESLEQVASASRGTLFNVAGSADAAFQRLRSELSGYYLLGIESEPKDKDGKAHSLRVEVARRGVEVRSRRQIMAIRAEQRVQTRQQTAIAALGSPLLLSALPLRVATFSLLGPESGKVQLLIHADVGTDYSSSKAVSLAYIIINRDGRVVESQVSDARLFPVMNGVPTPLQLAAGASLSPGDYTLKLAVAEGDRVGTIEHPVHATVVNVGDIKLSELMVGGPAAPGELLQPTVGYRVSFGSVHGYVEAYGREGHALNVKYEIASSVEAAPLVSADVKPRTAGEERTIFSGVLPVRQLPPGRYLLRATVSDKDRALKTMTSPFEIAVPAVLMTSAEGTGAPPVAPSEIFLPVADEMFTRPFRREDAMRSDALRSLLANTEPAARPAFDRGASFLGRGAYVDAEQSFKEAIAIDAASTGALVYLAATYAASGHDMEAASAWQTALIDAADLPQIYSWLGDALLRTHELAQARTVLEEAATKWPGDIRFTLPLALVYATFGQGREAVRTLERHLSTHTDDHVAQAMGVEWIYHLRAAGAAARTPAEDLKLARAWADAYAKSKGPQAALVSEWLRFLEAGGRK